ncbi:DNA polymerase [Streptomyces sp. MI02-2A]|uniref:DNA polymerase n=1 Tax=Streptomyces sp. MI02-2A TaxID=3028688 RepID=UPI0029BD9348|nr:DNA polymerase [Streptomyces sp. MI02-2A]MDX3260727.1 DNA polymerase [Streptomyces sp. MI02-2A]
MPIRDSVILTPDRLNTVVERFMERPAFSFDIETFGPNRGVPTQNVANWLSMATDGIAVAIPFGHPNGDVLISKATKKKNKLTGKFDAIPAVYDEPPEQMLPSEVFSILRPLFFAEDKIKIAHNATFDLISTAKYWGEIAAPEYSDTIVLQWLLDENMKQKGLKELIKRYYKVDYDQENVGKCVEAHPFSKVAHYAYMDAKYTWLLWKRFQKLIAQQGLTHVRRLEEDVLGVLLDMGITGAPVDEAAMRELVKDMSERLVDIEGRIYKAAGQRFNLNAPAQKAAVLYAPKSEGGQGLKPLKPTDGGKKKRDAGQELEWKDYSTDSDSLEKHPNNDVVKAMLEYAEVSKLMSYPVAYLGDPDDKDKPCRIFDGRIHADFVQYGTVSGRFSCREPNLQNIPRPSTELGKRIRGLFIAPPGYKLVVADYGQIELVVLAHFIGRGDLYKGFHNGVDPHSATAAALMGVDAKEFMAKVKAGDKECIDFRQVAKGINFAVVYGAGPEKVASMAGISVKEAKKFMETHQKLFPEIYRFKEDVIRVCRSRRPPYIRTLLGRKRRLPLILSSNNGLRMGAERQAVNSLIQGSAADLIKLAMIRLNNSLPDDIRLILSVHDEVVVLAPEDRAQEAVELVKEAMLGEGIQKLLRVPLSSDVKIVDRWSEAK